MTRCPAYSTHGVAFLDPGARGGAVGRHVTDFDTVGFAHAELGGAVFVDFEKPDPEIASVQSQGLLNEDPRSAMGRRRRGRRLGQYRTEGE